jgi:hypothetical protein
MSILLLGTSLEKNKWLFTKRPTLIFVYFFDWVRVCNELCLSLGRYNFPNDTFDTNRANCQLMICKIIYFACFCHIDGRTQELMQWRLIHLSFLLKNIQKTQHLTWKFWTFARDIVKIMFVKKVLRLFATQPNLSIFRFLKKESWLFAAFYLNGYSIPPGNIRNEKIPLSGSCSVRAWLDCCRWFGRSVFVCVEFPLSGWICFGQGVYFCWLSFFTKWNVMRTAYLSLW